MITPRRQTPLLPGTLANLFYPPPDYRYFARAVEVPFALVGTTAKAAWAADASMLAYARYGDRRMSDGELDDNFGRAGMAYEKIGGTIGNWNAPGTQAIFAACDSFAILAFRGTEPDDPADLLTDADLVPTLEANLQLFRAPSLVHRGFQEALNQVWDHVRPLVMNYRGDHPKSEICFTGHSLGGALATLAFSRLADPAMTLHTFGCPRVGNAAFRDRVEANTGKGVFRFVNFNDAVTHVPTDSLLYRQAPGRCYRFTAEGKLLMEEKEDSLEGDVDSIIAAITGLPASFRLGNIDTIPAPPSLVDHSPARYCFRLWDCV